jgi:hypothetical protein
MLENVKDPVGFMNAQSSAQALAEYWQQHEGVLADDLPLADDC